MPRILITTGIQLHWKSTTLVVLVTVLLIICVSGALFELQPKWREPLSTAFKDGNFARILVEAYNALAICDPAHRPILVVREVQNLDAESSDSLFSSLEQMKEGWFHFPVLLETSDTGRPRKAGPPGKHHHRRGVHSPSQAADADSAGDTAAKCN